MSLAERSITATAWNISASAARVAILLARSILLARLLPVSAFGVYALAESIIIISGILARFGTGPAFMHRAAETEDVERAARVHFTLRLVTSLSWLSLLSLGALVFTEGDLRFALIVRALAFTGIALTDTPRLILSKRVVHRRLALMTVIDDVISTIVAIFLAWRGFTIGALVATDVVSMCVTAFMLYVWRPFWRPKLLWDAAVARYYLRFGRSAVAVEALAQGVENIDELWIGARLGTTQLGYYSRAYTFATYPRRILAVPIVTVAGGAYSELKYERERLGKAFFQSNALLVRTGFVLAGLLVLLAPQVVRVLLGPKWLPMVPTFQLMLVFTLLDPVRSTCGTLFTALGKLDYLIRLQAAQLAILVAGLVTFGARWGIEGVAVTIDIMLIAATVLSLREARKHIDFSIWRLFGPPTVALVAGTLALLGANRALCVSGAAPGLCASDVGVILVGGGLFCLGFAAASLLLERNLILSMVHQVRGALFHRPAAMLPPEQDPG